MLNRFYYIRPFSMLPPPPATATGIVAHTVDAGHGPLLAHQFSPAGNYPFCLHLRDAAAATPDTLKELLLFFFHPFYAATAGRKPLLIDIPAESLPTHVRQIFDAHHIDLYPLPVSSLKCLCADSYYQYCTTEYDPADNFLLQAADDAAAVRAIEDLHRTMADLRERFPQLYRLALAHSDARHQLDRLIHERTSLAEERTILQQLLDLSNKHDEVNYILHFYRNEYEILPLWYKRFGHILKVIAGKRSFRSLYDKTAKKYKD